MKVRQLQKSQRPHYVWVAALIHPLTATWQEWKIEYGSGLLSWVCWWMTGAEIDAETWERFRHAELTRDQVCHKWEDKAWCFCDRTDDT